MFFLVLPPNCPSHGHLFPSPFAYLPSSLTPTFYPFFLYSLSSDFLSAHLPILYIFFSLLSPFPSLIRPAAFSPSLFHSLCHHCPLLIDGSFTSPCRGWADALLQFFQVSGSVGRWIKYEFNSGRIVAAIFGIITIRKKQMTFDILALTCMNRDVNTSSNTLAFNINQR